MILLVRSLTLEGSINGIIYYFKPQWGKLTEAKVSSENCILGSFCCRLPTFFKINVFKKFFHEHYQSVKLLGSRPGPTFCRSCSGSKLFAKVISRRQKPPLARKELTLLCSVKHIILDIFIRGKFNNARACITGARCSDTYLYS